MFIYNSSSKNGRKTTTSKLPTHRSLAGLVVSANFCNFAGLSARFPRTNLDTKIVNFVLKLVLRELPKGNTVNFSHFYVMIIAKIVF